MSLIGTLKNRLTGILFLQRASDSIQTLKFEYKIYTVLNITFHNICKVALTMIHNRLFCNNNNKKKFYKGKMLRASTANITFTFHSYIHNKTIVKSIENSSQRWKTMAKKI